MCDCDDGAVLELGPNCLLNQVICVHVDRRCGLVQNEHLGVLNERAGETHQLLLTHTEINSTIADCEFT